MKNVIFLICGIALLTLTAALAFGHAAAQNDSPAYMIVRSAFGGIETTPSKATDYSLVAASDPNAQQSLSGGNYSLSSAHPGLLSRVPSSEQPDEEQPDEEQPDENQPDEQPEDEQPGTLFIPAVER